MYSELSFRQLDLSFYFSIYTASICTSCDKAVSTVASIVVSSKKEKVWSYSLLKLLINLLDSTLNQSGILSMWLLFFLSGWSN